MRYRNGRKWKAEKLMEREMTSNKTIMERQKRRVRMGEQKKKRKSWASKKVEDAGKQKVESKRKGVGTKIMWWNGGGKLTSRIKVNPGLKQLLENKPDIFAYGEALMYEATKELEIQGYRAIVHKSEKKTKRRGIVVHYRKKLENVISKEQSSNRFDIIWLRLKSPEEECLIAFFYAPGANHEEKHEKSSTMS